MQQTRTQTIGAWLGLFAIAMLFIGPIIGQWRASVLHSTANAAHAEHASHASHASDSHALVEQGALALASTTVTTSHAMASERVGALLLDHCGYCHLQASFAALPATEWPMLPPFWAAPEQPLWRYQAPRPAWPSVVTARAPPALSA